MLLHSLKKKQLYLDSAPPRGPARSFRLGLGSGWSGEGREGGVTLGGIGTGCCLALPCDQAVATVHLQPRHAPFDWQWFTKRALHDYQLTSAPFQRRSPDIRLPLDPLQVPTIRCLLLGRRPFCSLALKFTHTNNATGRLVSKEADRTDFYTPLATGPWRRECLYFDNR